MLNLSNFQTKPNQTVICPHLPWVLDLPGHTLLHRGQCANWGLCVTCKILVNIVIVIIVCKLGALFNLQIQGYIVLVMVIVIIVCKLGALCNLQ